MRRAAAHRATELIRDGSVLGLGTGRTASLAIDMIAAMASEGMEFICIPTSNATEQYARKLGLKLSSMDEHPEIDYTIDGADEFDIHRNLIKGKGGALLREKIVASATREEIIVVDEEKAVQRLGEKEAVPVELFPYGYRATLRKLEALGCTPLLRMNNGRHFVTDNGNLIADCKFGPISDPQELHRRLNDIPGVLENGIFLGLAKKIVVGTAEGIREL